MKETRTTKEIEAEIKIEDQLEQPDNPDTFRLDGWMVAIDRRQYVVAGETLEFTQLVLLDGPET